MVVGGRELIDTLWNVNENGGIILFLNLGINRYIMECKFAEFYSTEAGVRINRYIMECKLV